MHDVGAYWRHAYVINISRTYSNQNFFMQLLSIFLMNERERKWKRETPEALKAFQRPHNLKCDRHAKALLMFKEWMVAAVHSRGPTAWISQEPDGLHAAPSLRTSAYWHVMWSWWHWQRCYWGTAQRQQAPPGNCALCETPGAAQPSSVQPSSPPQTPQHLPA